MTQQKASCCSYVSSKGQHCHQTVNANEHLCFWHDPDIDKSEETDLVERLKEWAAAGNVISGISLRRANLRGLSLPRKQYEMLDLTDVDFYRADLQEAHLYSADLTHASLMKANLSKANMNGAILHQANLLGVILHETNIERVSWGTKLFQEKLGNQLKKVKAHEQAKEMYVEAEEVYRRMYLECQMRGLYDDTSHFYVRERVMRRYLLDKYSFPWFVSAGVELVCGYGERPERVVFFSFLFIFCCSLLFFALGIQTADGVISAASCSPSGCVTSYFESLYFSIVTFTTLGYGDIVPIGWSRLVAAIEAFTGSFTMALYVVVFVKKITR